MAMKNLEDALYEEMRDMLSAEKQISKALKKMARKASSDELKQAFEHHLGQTEGQIERLEQAFETMDRKARARHCDGIAGILSEGDEVMEEAAETEVLDAVMIAAAQKVEHYEIASYGTICEWAKLLGFDAAAKLMHESLEEEKQTDEKLTALAAELNRQAQPTS